MNIEKAKVGMKVVVTKRHEFMISGGWLPDTYIIGRGRHCRIVEVDKKEGKVIVEVVNKDRGYVHMISKVCLRGRNHYGSDLSYGFPAGDLRLM